jgi:uncharacterized protein (UPF0335 family)
MSGDEKLIEIIERLKRIEQEVNNIEAMLAELLAEALGEEVR